MEVKTHHDHRDVKVSHHDYKSSRRKRSGSGEHVDVKIVEEVVVVREGGHERRGDRGRRGEHHEGGRRIVKEEVIIKETIRKGGHDGRRGRRDH